MSLLGLALGLVTLGRGSDAPGLSDLHIENRLAQYMQGGKEPETDDATGRKKQIRQNMSKSSRIKEGEMVNVDVTAPGRSCDRLGMLLIIFARGTACT